MLILNGIAYVRSDAVLAIARVLGGPWRLVALARCFPRRLRDWAYDLFARNRTRWFGRDTSCAVFPESLHERFLDDEDEHVTPPR